MRTIEQGMNKLNSFPSPRVTSYSVNVRFKLRISQNRKYVDENCPEQFLCIKLALNYLFFS